MAYVEAHYLGRLDAHAIRRYTAWRITRLAYWPGTLTDCLKT